MRAMTLEGLGNGFRRLPKSNVQKTTAYYIFDKAEVHLFSLDAAHFRAMNNRMGDSVIGASNAQDVEAAASEMISTGATIWTIITQFIEGAAITFPDPQIPVRIYKRILSHLENHLTEMRTNLRYDAPELEDFRQMAEFATSIRSTAMHYDPDLEKKTPGDGLGNWFTSRPVFRVGETQATVKKPSAPKSVTTLDAIERFMELCNGN